MRGTKVAGVSLGRSWSDKAGVAPVINSSSQQRAINGIVELRKRKRSLYFAARSCGIGRRAAMELLAADRRYALSRPTVSPLCVGFPIALATHPGGQTADQQPAASLRCGGVGGIIRTNKPVRGPVN